MRHLLLATRKKLPLALEIAPLIDILLLLLVFVLLTSAFSVPDVSIDLSVAHSGEQTPLSLVVAITDNNEIIFRGSSLSASALATELRSSLESGPVQKVSIEAYHSTSVQRVIEVIDACHAAGVKDTVLAVETSQR